MVELVDQLAERGTLDDEAFLALINNDDEHVAGYLRGKARETTLARFGNAVYMRGLIEFTNYCKNDCLYCGIRRGNREAVRYRLTPEQVLECCHTGHALGFRTFVLQGGEDPGYADAQLVELLRQIKAAHPDCAVTLSFGEKSEAVYRSYRDAGADRYLLRHETADAMHYAKLHPASMLLERRKQCLYTLKKLGYQVGTGFMVGSPYQTPHTILQDLRFIEALQPQMVGIGPYLPHAQTPFAHMPEGSMQLTLNLLAILRLMMPALLIPSTTALGTIDPEGRELGILAGANVVMPNLSPVGVREKYMLYNNKIATNEEAAESKHLLEKKLASIGYRLVVTRGDYAVSPLEND